MRQTALLLFILLSTPGLAEEVPKSIYRFCFVGCNRVGFEVNPAENPSTANVQQLLNTFEEVAQAEPKPSHFFYLGDLILGYTGYLSTVDQLEAWKRLYYKSGFHRSGVTLVPIVGNHEVLLSYQDKLKKWHDYPNPSAAKAWSEVMTPLNRWRDGPTTAPPNRDSLTMSQEDLSFTLRDKDIFFIILNTDTFVDNITTGDIPLHWLEEKLNLAERDETIKHVFVMGHKPIYRPGLPAWIVREDEQEPAQELLATHGKVRAYLTAHYHFWDFRLMPSGIPQIIAGNNGSLLKGPFADPEKGYFGHTFIDIMDNNEIVVESWGRPAPEPYYDESPQPKASLRDRHIIRLVD